MNTERLLAAVLASHTPSHAAKITHVDGGLPVVSIYQEAADSGGGRLLITDDEADLITDH